MRILKSPVFIVCCILFVLHQFMQKVMGVSIPIVDSYLDTLLAMPIILTLLVAERRVLFRRGENYRLTIPDVIVATLFVAFVSEVIFPALSDSFTGDWLDLVFYSLGSLVFLLTINPSKKSAAES